MATAAQDDAPMATNTKEEDHNLKAVKADNAAIPVELWNGKVHRALALPEEDVTEDALTKALDALHKGALHYWHWKVARDFWTWWMWDKHLQKEQGLSPCLEALEPGLLLALKHSVDASWWDWDRGLAPFFWRFPKMWQAEAQDGLPPCFTGKPPSWKKPQRHNKDDDAHTKERRKIAKVRQCRYISARAGMHSGMILSVHNPCALTPTLTLLVIGHSYSMQHFSFEH